MPPLSSTMTIGQLAAAAGVPATTVRYYERVGLLKPAARTRGNYRAYTAASLDRLRLIRVARAAGLSMEDVASLFRLTDGHPGPCDEVQTIVRQRLADVERRLKEMRSVKAALESALRSCRAAPLGGLCGDLASFSQT